MVPTLRCGLFLSNFALAIDLFVPSFSSGYVLMSRRICFCPVSSFRRRNDCGGAHNRIRTDDLALTKGVLCQLSYVGECPFLGPPRAGFPFITASYHDRAFFFWCQGQDSNLRSPSGQRFYRPSVLATHPPWRKDSWSPRGDSNPQPTDYKSVALPLRHSGVR